MELLNEETLKWSAIVANCNMNRKRNLIGVNSYQKDIQFDIVDYLKSKINTNGRANWVDLCCGEGKAIIQASEKFRELNLMDNIELEGVDLVGMFDNCEPKNRIKFIVQSLVDWVPDKKYDLITCVHGLHYIGDKLVVIEKALAALKSSGKFIANIDLGNVKDQDGRSLGSNLIEQLSRLNIEYDSRKKMLVCEGNRAIQFDYAYLGADDTIGKNYTGQEVVGSFYRRE